MTILVLIFNRITYIVSGCYLNITYSNSRWGSSVLYGQLSRNVRTIMATSNKNVDQIWCAQRVSGITFIGYA